MLITKKFRRRFAVVFGAIMLLLVSGCGVKYVEENGKAVTNPETGAKIVKNVIDENVTVLGEISDGNIITGLLIVPLSKLIGFLGELFGNFAVAIILATILVRLIALPLTLKSAKQTKKQRELHPQIQKIQQKYAGRTDTQSKMMMQQEIQKLYRDNGVNLLGGCLGMIITLPIFFAFYSAIYRTPGVFEDSFLSFELGVTPSLMLKNGEYIYLLFPIIVGLLNYLSMKISTNASKAPKADVKRPYNHAASDKPNMMESQMKIMKFIMPVMIGFISFTLPVGIGVYFMSSAVVQIAQSFIVKKV